MGVRGTSAQARDIAMAASEGMLMSHDLLALLDRVVGADNFATSGALDVNGPSSPDIQLRGTSPMTGEEVQLWNQLLPTHPYAAYLALGPDRASRLTDVVTIATFERTEVYQRLLRDRGSRFQAALPLVREPGNLTLAALWRSDRDFTEAEVDELELIRRPVAAGFALGAALRALRASTAEGLPEASLTTRQQQVVLLVAHGLTNESVARRLQITPRTVRKHLQDVFASTGCRSRTEVAVWWSQGGSSATTGQPRGTRR